MRYVTLIAITGLLVSAPAVLVAGTEPSADDKAGQKLICKQKPRTGTRLPSKMCRTALQWDQMAEAHKRNFAEVANRPAIETRR